MTPLTATIKAHAESKHKKPADHDAYMMASYNDDVDNTIKRITAELPAMLDKRYIDTTFDDYKIIPENKEAIRDIMSWFSDYTPGNWIVLRGSQGCGKTMLKNILIKELYFRHNVKTVSCTLYSLYITYLDTLKIGSTKRLLDKLGKADLLVVDELSRKGITQALKDFVFEVFDNLYLNKGSAILISNAETVTDYVDASRLSEVGLSYVMKGEDQRLKRGVV